MGCSSCGGAAALVKKIKRAGNDIVNILSGRKVAKSVWEVRMHACKGCGFFKADEWLCRMENADARQLCWSKSCPMKSWV